MSRHLLYRTLQAELSAFLENPSDAQAGEGLPRLLEELRWELADPDPLRCPGPDAPVRAQIQSGRVDYDGESREVNRAVQAELLALSDDLALHESVCLELWATVSRNSARLELERALALPPGALAHDLPLAARQLWLLEQKLRLHCTCEIIKSCMDSALMPEKKALIEREAKMLMHDGKLASNLMRSLERLLAREAAGPAIAAAAAAAAASASTAASWPGIAVPLAIGAAGATAVANFVEEARIRVAECLFYAMYTNITVSPASGAEALQLVQLLRSCSSSLAEAAAEAAADGRAAGVIGGGTGSVINDLMASPLLGAGDNGGAHSRSWASPQGPKSLEARRHASLFHSTTALLAALCCAFAQQPERDGGSGADDDDDGSENPLMPLPPALPPPEVATIKRVLDERWEHRPVQGVAMLAWALLQEPRVMANGIADDADDMMRATDEARLCRSFSFLAGPVLCTRRFATAAAAATAACHMAQPPLVAPDAPSSIFYFDVFADVLQGYLRLRTAVSEALGAGTTLPSARDRHEEEVRYQFDHAAMLDAAEDDGDSGAAGGRSAADEAAAEAEQLAADCMEDVILLVATLSDLYPTLPAKLWSSGVAERLCAGVSDLLHEQHTLLAPFLQLMAALATAPPPTPGAAAAPSAVRPPRSVCKLLSNHPKGWDFLLLRVEVMANQVAAPQQPQRGGMGMQLPAGGGHGGGYGGEYGYGQEAWRSEEGKQPGGSGRGGARVSARAEEAYLAVAALVQRCAAGDKDSLLWLVHKGAAERLLQLALAPVPPRLRGALFKALAVLAQDPATATMLWNRLDAAGVLGGDAGYGGVALPPAGAAATAAVGLRYELSTVEAQDREYPATEGFCCLLAQLVSREVPHDLGQGRRLPGVGPYVDFLVEDVLLPAAARRHREPGERWRIVARVLQALVTLVRRYPMVGRQLVAAVELSSPLDKAECEADFGPERVYHVPAAAAALGVHGGIGASGIEIVPAGMRAVPRRKSPGFELMWEMLSGGRLLSAVLDVVVGESAGPAAAAKERADQAVDATLAALMAAAAIATRPRSASTRGGAAGGGAAAGGSLRGRFSAPPAAPPALAPVASARRRSGGLPEEDWGWWRQRCEALALSLLHAVAERDLAFIQRVRSCNYPLSLATPTWETGCGPADLQRAGAALLTRLPQLLAQDTSLRRREDDFDDGGSSISGWGTPAWNEGSAGGGTPRLRVLPGVAMYIGSDSNAAVPLLATRLVSLFADALTQGELLAAATDTGEEALLASAFARRAAGIPTRWADVASSDSDALGTGPPQGADTDVMSLDPRLLGVDSVAAAKAGAAAAAAAKAAAARERADDGTGVEEEAARAAAWAATSKAKAQAQHELQILTMNLLLQGVDKPPPTLSHILMGLGPVVRAAGADRAVAREVLATWWPRVPAKSSATASAVSGNAEPADCLEAVLQLLLGAALMARMPDGASRGLELIYRLCAAPATSVAVLTLLRRDDVDFWRVHLSRAAADPWLYAGTGNNWGPQAAEGPAITEEEAAAAAISRRSAVSWLLRGAAVEMKIACEVAAPLPARASRLLAALLGAGAGIGTEAAAAAALAASDEAGQVATAGAAAAAEDGCLPRLLSALELSGGAGPGALRQPLRSEIDHFMMVAEAPGGGGLTRFYLVQVEQLREALQRRLDLAMVEDGGANGDARRDVDEALAWAKQWNCWVMSLSQAATACDAWQQALGVCVQAGGSQLSPVGRMAAVGTLELALRRLAGEACDPMLAAPVSRGCVSVTGAMWKWEADIAVAIPTAGAGSGATIPPRLRLLLLQLLVAALTRGGGGGGGGGSGSGGGGGFSEAYRLEMYLCGTLLLQGKGKVRRATATAMGAAVPAKLAAAAALLEQRRQSAAVLERHLEALMSMLARDVREASDACRAAAMAMLGTVLAVLAEEGQENDGRSSAEMAAGSASPSLSSPYLRRTEAAGGDLDRAAKAIELLAGGAGSDFMQQLVQELASGSLAATAGGPGGGAGSGLISHMDTGSSGSSSSTLWLEVNQAVVPGALALLTRVACIKEGAKLLVARRLVAQLATSQWLNSLLYQAGDGATSTGAFGGGNTGDGALAAAAAELVNLVWLPLLRLLQALLASLPESDDLAKQVTAFVVTHHKQLGRDLRLKSSRSLNALRSAAAAAAVLAALAARPNEWKEVLNSTPTGNKLAARMLKLLASLGRFPYPPSLLLERAGGERGNGTYDTGILGGVAGVSSASSWWDSMPPASLEEQHAAMTPWEAPPGAPAAGAGAGAAWSNSGGGGNGGSRVAWTLFDAERLAASQEALCALAAFARRLPAFVEVAPAVACALAEPLAACARVLDAVAAGAAGMGQLGEGSSSGAEPFAGAAADAANGIGLSGGYGYLPSSLSFVVENLVAAAFGCAVAAAGRGGRAEQAEAARMRESFGSTLHRLADKANGGFAAAAARQTLQRLAPRGSASGKSGGFAFQEPDLAGRGY